MNPEDSLTPREQLEVSITAMLLGEMPKADAAALRKRIADDAELSALHDRLRNAIELVRETSATEAAAPLPEAPARLSDERRQKLLAHFKTTPLPAPAPRKRNWVWIAQVGMAAALTLLAGGALLVQWHGYVNTKAAQGFTPEGRDYVVMGDEGGLYARDGAQGEDKRGRAQSPASAPMDPAAVPQVGQFGRETNALASPAAPAPPLPVDPLGSASVPLSQWQSQPGLITSNNPSDEAVKQLLALSQLNESLSASNQPPSGGAAAGGAQLNFNNQTGRADSDRFGVPGSALAPLPPANPEPSQAPVSSLAVTMAGRAGGPARSAVNRVSDQDDTLSVLGDAKAAPVQLDELTEGAKRGLAPAAEPRSGGRERVAESKPAASAASAPAPAEQIAVLRPVPAKAGEKADVAEQLGREVKQKELAERDASAKDYAAMNWSMSGPRGDLGVQSANQQSRGYSGQLAKPAAEKPAQTAARDVAVQTEHMEELSKTLAAGSRAKASAPQLETVPRGERPDASVPPQSPPVVGAAPVLGNLFQSRDSQNREQFYRFGETAAQEPAQTAAADVSLQTADSATAGKKLEAASKAKAQGIERQIFRRREIADAPARPQTPPAATPLPEIQTAENAFSTFSLNVADVSFKLAGASLEQGKMPEPGGIRSEEFVNAFDYRDPEPAPGTPLAFVSERARYPFAQNRDVLRLSVKTAAAGRQPGRALNLVLLLDSSGSMERADRVRIVHEALTVLAGQLQKQDHLSVITFARTPRLWADGVAGDQATKLVSRVGEIIPQGGTNLSEALALGYQTAQKHYQAGAVNRVVLLTDGAANLGEVNPETLKSTVERHRKEGIALDCFGVGWENYDDEVLEALSRNGDGRYGFLNSPEEAATEFAGQLAGALRVAASDVKTQVEFNPKRVTAWRQIGYAKHQLTKEQFRDNSVDAAEIGAAEAGNALYVLEVNPRGDGDLATVRVRFKTPGTNDYRELEWSVPFTGDATPLEQASPSLRLATVAGAFAEQLAGSPFATEVSSDRLLRLLNGVADTYGVDPRPRRLEWMIRQAKSVSGR